MKLKSFFLFLVLFSLCPFIALQAQRFDKATLKNLVRIDDSLAKYSVQILDEPLPGNRLRADSMFTRILVRGLLVPYSYYYPFDSLKTAPIVYPADSSFRIITWHYTVNDVDFHQRGALQINTPDGSLKLFPLYDISDYSDNLLDSIRTPTNWVGAIYYRIIQKTWQEKNVYTLLGYDENNDRTTRKWMEMLSFNDRGEPRWGGSFLGGTNEVKQKTAKRFLMEYKKAASAKLNYDAEEDMIILDHLISQTNEPEKTYTLVPGGDYEGFKWTNGFWVNESKLFTQNLGDGNEPNPAMILNDETGLADESILIEQSAKNVNGAAKASKPAPKKTPKKQG